MSVDLWLQDLVDGEIGLSLRCTNILHASTTPFQRLAVYDTVALGRVLVLGNAIVLSDADEAIYHEGLVHPTMQCHPDPKRVLILGGGDGGIAREVARYRSVESIRVVEIDQALVEVCRSWFPSCAAGLDDPRCELVIDDAHRHLTDDDSLWDLIIVDAEELDDAASATVVSSSFADALAARLAPGGMVVAPLGNPHHDGDRCRRSLRELADATTETQVYQVVLPSLAGGSLAIARAANGAFRTGEPFVDEAMAEQLSWWEPTLQGRLFTLPKPLRNQLDLV